MARKEKAVPGKDLGIPATEGNLGKEAISPMERWKMVAEAAYYRAQKRGFIGGNPMDDWMEAEREIDAEYTVDYGKIMALLDPSEMMKQFARAFHGILQQPNLDLDDILESQRKNIEALTDANKLVFDNAQRIMEHQVEMFRYAMEQAVSSVKSASKSKSAKEITAQQVKLIELGVEKSLAGMRDITESIIDANTRAFDIANKRMTENMSEFKRNLQKIKE